MFRSGRRYDGRYLQLIATPAVHRAGRAGFVVGRKVMPRAVDRNRLKRMLREVLRAARPAIDGVDVIVRVKRPLPRAELRAAAVEAKTLVAGLPRG